MSAISPRRFLALALLFLALTIPLAWIWLEWVQSPYAKLLLDLLTPVYRVLGLQHQRGNPVGPRLVGVVPFVVLAAITPGMAWRRKAWVIALGLVVMALVHLCLFVFVDSVYAVHGRTRRALSKIVPLLLVNDGVPFLLWLFFARDFLRRAVPGLREPEGEGPP